MNDPIRRLVAFVAGVVVEGHQAEGVFDFEIGSRFPVSGTIDGDDVDIVDETAGVRLAGTSPALRQDDVGTVELHIEDDDFSGVDHVTGVRFDGRVSGRNVDLNDRATGVTHIYCL